MSDKQKIERTQSHRLAMECWSDAHLLAAIGRICESSDFRSARGQQAAKEILAVCAKHRPPLFRDAAHLNGESWP